MIKILKMWLNRAAARIHCRRRSRDLPPARETQGIPPRVVVAVEPLLSIVAEEYDEHGLTTEALISFANGRYHTSPKSRS
jgi:hypothetical protein